MIGEILAIDANKATKIWIDTNSLNEYYNRSSLEDFWLTLSPWGYGVNDGPAVFDTAQGILFFAFLSIDHTVRPVTSLKSCVTWKSGNGSASSPYEILEDGGC